MNCLPFFRKSPISLSRSQWSSFNFIPIEQFEWRIRYCKLTDVEFPAQIPNQNMRFPLFAQIYICFIFISHQILFYQIVKNINSKWWCTYIDIKNTQNRLLRTYHAHIFSLHNNLIQLKKSCIHEHFRAGWNINESRYRWMLTLSFWKILIINIWEQHTQWYKWVKILCKNHTACTNSILIIYIFMYIKVYQ